MNKQFILNLVKLPKLNRVTGEDGKRYYENEKGIRYISVTTFLGQDNDGFIEKWRMRVGEEKADAISRRAAQRGTNLHECLEQTLLNNPPSWAELSKDLLNKSLFLQMKPLIDRIDNIRMLEGMMYSDSLKLAGTTDCIADFDGILSVIDFKTSLRIKEDKDIEGYWIQCACYALMYSQHYDELPDQAVILMAVEGHGKGLLFKKPMMECLSLLQKFYEKYKHTLA